MKLGGSLNQEKIGNIIKDIRLKNNLTQKEFADKYGVTYQAVSKWENGLNIPDITILKEICDDYNLDINFLLSGNSKHKRKYFIIITIVTIILISILLIIFLTKKDPIKLKPIVSNCDNFNVTGVIAYNKDNSSIYISDINYCGEEDKKEYKKITCTLYEDHNNKSVKVYTYSKKNISLDSFLNNIDFHIDNYKSSCNFILKDEFYLVIETLDNNKTVSYKIPLKLKNNCKQ